MRRMSCAEPIASSEAIRSASTFNSRPPGYAKKSSSGRTAASVVSTAARPALPLPLRASAAQVWARAFSSRQRSIRAADVEKKWSKDVVVSVVGTWFLLVSAIRADRARASSRRPHSRSQPLFARRTRTQPESAPRC